MEPLFFKAENLPKVRYPSMPPGRFNGAAFFQSGKYKGDVPGARCGNLASMEPLFFKAENLVVTHDREF